MLFAVLGCSRSCGTDRSAARSPAAPDGLLFAILDDLVEYGGGLMILTAFVLLVATGIGNRWFAAGRGIARLTSVTTIVCAASIKMIGSRMVLLSGATTRTPG